MSRALAHRVTKLEQQARARTLSMAWPDVHAAVERLCSHARATITALLHGQDPPVYDETQAEADSAIFDRVCRDAGFSHDREDARAWLEAELAKMAACIRAAPSDRLTRSTTSA